MTGGANISCHSVSQENGGAIGPYANITPRAASIAGKSSPVRFKTVVECATAILDFDEKSN
jgi:hypothetical protein